MLSTCLNMMDGMRDAMGEQFVPVRITGDLRKLTNGIDKLNSACKVKRSILHSFEDLSSVSQKVTVLDRNITEQAPNIALTRGEAEGGNDGERVILTGKVSNDSRKGKESTGQEVHGVHELHPPVVTLDSDADSSDRTGSYVTGKNEIAGCVRGSENVT